MEYSKPKVTIDLEEYQELLKNQNTPKDRRTEDFDEDTNKFLVKIARAAILLANREPTYNAIKWLIDNSEFNIVVESDTSDKKLEDINIKIFKK